MAHDVGVDVVKDRAPGTGAAARAAALAQVAALAQAAEEEKDATASAG